MVKKQAGKRMSGVIFQKNYFALERRKGQNVILGTLSGEKKSIF